MAELTQQLRACHQDQVLERVACNGVIQLVGKPMHEAPQLTRPWDMASLHELVRDLYGSDLEHKIADADLRIADGTRRVADEIRRIETCAAAGHGKIDSAGSVLSKMARAVRHMRTSRALMVGQLDALNNRAT